MKRSIQLLVSKISHDNKGELTGGFGNIKGGIKQLPSNNETCTNNAGGTCDGTNSISCTNDGNCSNGTNKSTCTNSNTCFY